MATGPARLSSPQWPREGLTTTRVPWVRPRPSELPVIHLRVYHKHPRQPKRPTKVLPKMMARPLIRSKSELPLETPLPTEKIAATFQTYQMLPQLMHRPTTQWVRIWTDSITHTPGSLISCGPSLLTSSSLSSQVRYMLNMASQTTEDLACTTSTGWTA